MAAEVLEIIKHARSDKLAITIVECCKADGALHGRLSHLGMDAGACIALVRIMLALPHGSPDWGILAKWIPTVLVHLAVMGWATHPGVFAVLAKLLTSPCCTDAAHLDGLLTELDGYLGHAIVVRDIVPKRTDSGHVDVDKTREALTEEFQRHGSVTQLHFCSAAASEPPGAVMTDPSASTAPAETLYAVVAFAESDKVVDDAVKMSHGSTWNHGTLAVQRASEVLPQALRLAIDGALKAQPITQWKDVVMPVLRLALRCAPFLQAFSAFVPKVFEESQSPLRRGTPTRNGEFKDALMHRVDAKFAVRAHRARWRGVSRARIPCAVERSGARAHRARWRGVARVRACARAQHRARCARGAGALDAFGSHVRYSMRA